MTEPCKPDSDIHLTEVKWDGEKFVAKGERMEIITSSNGESWTLRESP